MGPDVIEWLGTTYKTILSRADTGGPMSIFDSVSRVDSGPPRHTHHAEDETFIILNGEIEFWLEGEVSTAGPCESVFVRRGQEHTFRVIGERPCRHLPILTPGGFEAFFTEMAMGGYRMPEDMAAVTKAAERHNLTFTGPPIGAE